MTSRGQSCKITKCSISRKPLEIETRFVLSTYINMYMIFQMATRHLTFNDLEGQKSRSFNQISYESSFLLKIILHWSLFLINCYKVLLLDPNGCHDIDLWWPWHINCAISSKLCKLSTCSVYIESTCLKWEYPHIHSYQSHSIDFDEYQATCHICQSVCVSVCLTRSLSVSKIAATNFCAETK